VTDTTKLAGLYTQVSALKPADYGTSSKATIDAVNTGIKSVAKDFSSIAKTARAPRVLMNEKHDNKATSTATTTNNH
jgi:hypothetical protein